jgi:hypothetical protein
MKEATTTGRPSVKPTAGVTSIFFIRDSRK